MKTQIEALELELDTALQLIRQNNAQPLSMALETVSLLQEGMEKLKRIVLKNRFGSQADEICFFKKTKPAFVSKLIQYQQILRIALHRPQGSEKPARKFLLRELQEVECFFDTHREFFNYYRTGGTYLDQQYFLRKGIATRLLAGTYYFEADSRFSTSHDLVAARLLANERLVPYLHQELQALRQGSTVASQKVPTHTALTWTDSKASLIELIYALHTQAVIDNGKADIKLIAGYFEQVFNIELGDYYRTFLELRNRKTGRTKFLDAMRDRLNRRMEERDDF